MTIIIHDSPPPVYDWDDSELQPLHIALGRALATWGTLEHTLSAWLSVIGRMPYPIAKDIFFSVHSFRARLDIVTAALVNSRATDENRRFASAAIAKAGDYSKFRNAFVHALPFVIINGDGSRTTVLAQPSGPIERKAIESPITINQLENCRKNFSALNRLMIEAHAQEFSDPPNRQAYIALRAKLLLQVEQLPNDVACSAPSKRQLGRERQRKAAAGKPIPKRSSGTAR